MGLLPFVLGDLLKATAAASIVFPTSRRA